MRWAKALNLEEGIHNLAQSGIYDFLSAEDLGLDKLELHIHDKHCDGLPALKEAIGSRYGVDAGSVLTAEGSSLANFLILAAWVGPGDQVLLEDPCYEPLDAVLESLDARITKVPVDGKEGHQALLSAFRSGKRGRYRAVVITNPHNPTGVVLAEDLLSELAAACDEQGAILLVDEVYRELQMEEPPGCAAHLGPSVVSTSSLTKSFGLGALRCGWAIGPRNLIDRANQLNDNLGVHHPPLIESFGAQLIGDEQRMESWRKRIADRLQTNRAALKSFLNDQTGFTGRSPTSGLVFFPRWEGSKAFPDADTLCRLAMEQARVAIVPGRFFSRPEHVRIGVGGPEDAVASALDALAQFINRR